MIGLLLVSGVAWVLILWAWRLQGAEDHRRKTSQTYIMLAGKNYVFIGILLFVPALIAPIWAVVAVLEDVPSISEVVATIIALSLLAGALILLFVVVHVTPWLVAIKAVKIDPNGLQVYNRLNKTTLFALNWRETFLLDIAGYHTSYVNSKSGTVYVAHSLYTFTAQGDRHRIMIHKKGHSGHTLPKLPRFTRATLIHYTEDENIFRELVEQYNTA